MDQPIINDVSKEASISILEILSEPIWKGDEPGKDSVNAYWEAKVLWCDTDASLFLIGLEEPGDVPIAQEAVILICEISPTYITKGRYRREAITTEKVVFRKVA